MKERNAHILPLRQFFHGKGLTKIFLDPTVRFVYLFRPPYIDEALYKLLSTGTTEKIIHDFPHDIFAQKIGTDRLIHRGKKPVNRPKDFVVRRGHCLFLHPFLHDFFRQIVVQPQDHRYNLICRKLKGNR